MEISKKDIKFFSTKSKTNEEKMATYPKTPGALADKLQKGRVELAELNSELKKLSLFKKIEKLKASQKDLEEHIINEMKKQRLESMGGKLVNISKTKSEKPIISDGSVLNEWVQKTGNVQIFQRKLHEGAIKEIIESGEKIPGLGFFAVEKLSVRKK